jgi:deoxyhypusine synthase
MEYVKDIKWKYNTTVSELLDNMNSLGFQSIELYKASQIIYKMKKENAKIYLTFTSNLGTSGLRGFFSQLIELGLVDEIVNYCWSN